MGDVCCFFFLLFYLLVHRYSHWLECFFVQGILKGFDQATNLILDESHERVYSTKEGVQQLVLGLYIIRGDNMYVNQLLSQLHLLIPHIKTKPPSHL
nr:sm-like protein LSM8 [Ipomoea batatas]